MHHRGKILFFVFLFNCYLGSLQGQEVVTASGGDASNPGGSLSYSVGQITFNYFVGDEGSSVAQGVQQPYEISIVTAIEHTEDILLGYKIYPNPTTGLFTLLVKPPLGKDLRYQLLNQLGIVLQENNIDSEKTDVSLDQYSYTMYFLKVIRDNKEVKVFKIIKR